MLGDKIKKLRYALGNYINFDSIMRNQLIIQKYHEYAYESSEKGISEKFNEKNRPLIISLTTYSKRIYEVYLVIESIFRQTVKPDKVILWLSEDEFEYDNLPIVLQIQEQRGLEIRFCKDLRSYKKLLFTIMDYVDSDIITVDDDFIYPRDFIENLLNTSRKYPTCVCYYRGSRILLKNKQIVPYAKWIESEEEYEPSLLNFATGAGGIFYPKGCFCKSVLDVDILLNLAPSADDIWFK